MNICDNNSETSNLNVKEVAMRKALLQQKKELLKQHLPKPTYNPAQQFKHRDRGIKAGRTSAK